MERIGQPNPAERAFRELAESEGWDVTKRGWPDFICRRNGELMAVEVKDGSDGLSHQQYETISDLRRAGIPTFVWTPGEGYSEVGPPVGESVFSLRAMISMLRESMNARLRPRVVPDDPPTVTQWTFVPDDPDTIEAVKRLCLTTHQPHHGSRKVIGTSGSWCSDLVVLSQKHTPEQILAMTGMPNLGLLRRSIDRAYEYMFRFQHERLHRSIGIWQSCTSCERAA